MGLGVEGYWGEHEFPVESPNGFCPEFMLWRLALRVDDDKNVAQGQDDSEVRVHLRVAAQKENGKLQTWEWPENGLCVRVSLCASILCDARLATAEVLLTSSAPVASLSMVLPASASIAVAEPDPLQKPLLSAFARLAPCKVSKSLELELGSDLDAAAACRYGLLLPLPLQSLQRDCPNLEDDTCWRCPAPLGGHCPYVIVLPSPAPPPDLDNIEMQDFSNLESTGFGIWDTGVVMALELPRLLRRSHRGSEECPLSLLELGCGAAPSASLAAALLGHDCVATDWEGALPALRVGEVSNSGLKHAAAAASGGLWRAELLDWRDPPGWVLSKQWDVVVGAGLMWSAVFETSSAEACRPAEMLRNPLLCLLARLRFREMLLAEREYEHRGSAAFFHGLRLFGLAAVRLARVTTSLAADIVVWRIQHCWADVKVPKAIAGNSSSGCASEPAARTLAAFLEARPWLRVGARIVDWSVVSVNAAQLDIGHTLVLGAGAGAACSNATLDSWRHFCICRGILATSCLVALEGPGATSDGFLAAASERGFALRLLARGVAATAAGAEDEATAIVVYALDWQVPDIHVRVLENGNVDVRIKLPAAWLSEGADGLEALCDGRILRFTWPRFGWHGHVELPLPGAAAAQAVAQPLACELRLRRRLLRVVLNAASER